MKIMRGLNGIQKTEVNDAQKLRDRLKEGYSKNMASLQDFPSSVQSLSRSHTILITVVI
jgi:hypothetical protein